MALLEKSYVVFNLKVLPELGRPCTRIVNRPIRGCVYGGMFGRMAMLMCGFLGICGGVG